jgi:uncharacterized membrane protein YoaK (UPF0700 family)
MNRERTLKVVMVLVGLLFLAGVYPLVMSLWKMNQSDYGDDMMLSLYVTLGIFLLTAARNPSANRSLIAFTAWSSFAHGAVMAGLAFHIPSERVGLLGAVAVLVVHRCSPNRPGSGEGVSRADIGSRRIGSHPAACPETG